MLKHLQHHALYILYTDLHLLVQVVYSEGDDGERQAGILMTNAAIQPGGTRTRVTQ